MLVLSRKIGQRIRIGNDVTITVVRITGGGVRIGIDAPKDLPVIREELVSELDAGDPVAHGARPGECVDPNIVPPQS